MPQRGALVIVFAALAALALPAHAGVAYLAPVDPTGFTTSVEQGGETLSDALISPCVGLIVGRPPSVGMPWGRVYVAPTSENGATGITVATLGTGGGVLTNTVVTGITWDGEAFMALVGGAALVRFSWTPTTKTITQIGGTIPIPIDKIPRNGIDEAHPLVFPGEACTACTAGAGSLPLILSRHTAWPVLYDEGSYPIGPRIMNTDANNNGESCTVASPPAGTNPIGWALGAQAHTACVKDILFAARWVQPNNDGTFSMYFQMAGQRYVYRAEGVTDRIAGSELPIVSLTIVATLFAPTPGYSMARTQGVHTCQYYVWPDHLSTDVFAFNVDTNSLGIPNRIRAVKVSGQIAPWLAAFAAGNDIYLTSSNRGDMVAARLNGTAMTAALDLAQTVLYENGCNSTANPCNATGGHVCVPNNRGDPVCTCPAPWQDSRLSGCFDLNECVHNLHNCTSPNQACVNIEGPLRFRCECAPGYAGDQCAPISVCATNPTACPAPTACVDTGAGAVCQCPMGFASDTPGGRCVAGMLVPAVDATSGAATITGSGAVVAVRVTGVPSTGGITFIAPSLADGGTLVLAFNSATFATTITDGSPVITIPNTVGTVVISGGTFTADTAGQFLLMTSSTTHVVFDGAHITLSSGGSQTFPPGTSVTLTNEAHFVGQIIAS